MKAWGNSVFGTGNSLCKGPEASVCLVYLRKSEGAPVVGDEPGKQRGPVSEGSVGPCEDSGSHVK